MVELERPNIVFIIIDDMGWMDLSCQGSNFYETPNIDRIAYEGVRFTRAYASCPVCSPTRASLMSGKYPARVGVTQWIGGGFAGKVIGAPYTHYLPLEEKTLAETLKENGYNTYHVGKWHLGDEKFYPEHQGFDVNVAGCHWGNPYNGYFSPYNMPNLPNGPKGEYLTDRLADEAIKLLNSNGNNPFFLYLPFYSVHKPIEAPKEDIEYFKEKRKRLGLDKVDTFEKERVDFHLEHKSTESLNHRIIQSDPAYAGMIYRLDKNIGRILDTLEDLKKSDNTIVVFYSDNGGLSTDTHNAPTCNAPLKYGKSYIYEGGIREPLLIRWPKKIPKNETSNAVITTPDFYPTLLDLCGIPLQKQQHVDGVSFGYLFSESNDKSRKIVKPKDRGPIFWHYPHYNRNGAKPASVIVDGKWKLIEWLEDGVLELYNLDNDIGETINLVDEETETRDRMHGLLLNWREEVNALIPKSNPNYHLCVARIKTRSKGVIKLDSNVLTVNMKISVDNPQLFDIPLYEILDEFQDKMINLKIGNFIRTGRFEEEDERVIFYDTHEESHIALQELLTDLIGKTVEINGWDDFANVPELPDHVLPQVEIIESSSNKKR